MFVSDESSLKLKMEKDRDEVDELFDEVEEAYTEKPYSYAEEVVNSIEQTYRQPKEIANERDREKNELTLKIGELKKKLNQTRNVRNPRKTSINQSLADKRKKLRAEIETIKDRLYQIDVEEKGSGMTSKDLVDATIKNQSKQ
jgi:hypothetical protein